MGLGKNGKPVEYTDVVGLGPQLPLGYNRWSLRHFYNKAYTIESGSVGQLTIGVFGDSIAGAKPGYIIPAMYRAYGYSGCGYGSVGGAMFGLTLTLAGGAYALDGTAGKDYDYSLWPTGVYTVLPNGGSVQYKVGGGSPSITKATVYYAVRPGGGTATVDFLNVSDAVVATETIDTDGAAVGAGKVEFTEETAALRTIKVTATSDATVYVLTALYRETASIGVINLHMSRGGIQLSDSNLWNQDVMDFVLGDTAPDLFFIEARELPDVWDTWLGKMQHAAPNCDCVCFGAGPKSSDAGQAPGETGQELSNAALKAACDKYGYLYYDTYLPYGSYETLADAGLDWDGDGTHLPGVASSFTANLFLTDTGMLDLLGAAEHRQVASTRVQSPEFMLTSTASRNKSLDGSEVLKCSQGYGLDTYIDSKRFVYFRTMDGTVVMRLQMAGTLGVLMNGTSPVPDNHLQNGMFQFYVDTASGKLMVKCKDTSGVVKTGEITLT